jgi:hypothetical protein
MIFSFIFDKILRGSPLGVKVSDARESIFLTLKKSKLLIVKTTINPSKNFVERVLLLNFDPLRMYKSTLLSFIKSFQLDNG